MKVFTSLPFFSEGQLATYNEIVGLVKTALPSVQLIELKDSPLQQITPLKDKIAAITKQVVADFHNEESPVRVILGYKNPTDLGGIFEKMTALRGNCGSILVINEEELLKQSFGLVLGKLSTGEYLVSTSKIFIEAVAALTVLKIQDNLVNEGMFIYSKDAFTAIDLSVSLGIQKTSTEFTKKEDFFVFLTALTMQGVPQQAVLDHLNNSGVTPTPVILGMMEGVEQYVIENSQPEAGKAIDPSLSIVKDDEAAIAEKVEDTTTVDDETESKTEAIEDTQDTKAETLDTTEYDSKSEAIEGTQESEAQTTETAAE